MLDDVGFVLASLHAQPCTSAFLGAVLAHDYDTHRHLINVGALCARVASTAGLSREQAVHVGQAGLFHDIGKLLVSPAVLNMRRPLDEQEWQLLRAHPQIGEAMLRSCGEHGLAATVRGHHERLDGSGYPDGLRGTRIGWTTRLLSVVDAYDALRAGRPYAPPVDHDAALERLTAARHLYDAEAVGALIDTLARKATSLAS